MSSRYDVPVDVDAPNSAHAIAVRLVGQNRRVLELGAASGHVTRVLTDRHCTVTAIERDPGAAQDLHGVAERVIVGDLDDPAVLEGLSAEYDVVLAGDVLEHLVDPDAVLRAAARLLVPGGRIVVSVPNVAHADVRISLLQGRWRYGPWGLLDRSHLRFFTRESVEQLVEQAGLVICDLQRVRLPAFETELNVDRLGVATEIVEQVLADPEAETYQFVFAAVREGPDDHLRRLADVKLGLEMGLARQTIARAAAEAELRQLRAQPEPSAALEDELRDLRKQREELISGGEAERTRLNREGTERERLLAVRTEALEAARRQRQEDLGHHRTEIEGLQAQLAASQSLAHPAESETPARPQAPAVLRGALRRVVRAARRRLRG